MTEGAPLFPGVEGSAFRRRYWNTCGIYGIVHRETGRSYVGSAVKIGRRWAAHVSNGRGNGRERIHAAIRLHGEGAFDFVVLEVCEPCCLLERERFWIEKMGSASTNGYNTIKNPAERLMGRKHSEATKLRMSMTRRGRKFSPEHIAAIAAAKRTPEARAAVAGWMTGRKKTPAQRALISEARKGKKLSKEHREKLSLSHRGHKPTDEARMKMSLAKKGRSLSAEHRAALSAASIRRYSKDTKLIQAA